MILGYHNGVCLWIFLLHLHMMLMPVDPNLVERLEV